jgi:rubrerythrin
MTTETAPGRGDTGRLPPGYFDKPEYLCPVCGPLYSDEVEDGKCKVCGEKLNGGKNE